MLVRLKVGWKAGTVVNMEVAAARELIACGRASAVKYDDRGKEILDNPEPKPSATNSPKKPEAKASIANPGDTSGGIAKSGDASSSTKPKAKTKK